MSNQNPRGTGGFQNWLIGLISVIIIILLITYLGGKNDSDGAALDATIDAQDMATDEAANTSPEESVPVLSIDALNLEDWELAERAERAIQSLGAGQVIQPWVALHPSKTDTAYFAATSYDEELDERFVGIYTYDTTDYSFERLFRRTYKPGMVDDLGEALPVFHVVGIDGDRLIILMRNAESVLDTCDHPIIIGTSGSDDFHLLSMSLEDPYGGFESYIPTEEMLEEATEQVASCEAE